MWQLCCGLLAVSCILLACWISRIQSRLNAIADAAASFLEDRPDA